MKKKIKIFAISILSLLPLANCNQYRTESNRSPADPQTQSITDYINSIRKIDIHTHIRSDAPYFRHVLDSINMKVCTICTGGTNPERIKKSIQSAREITSKYPRYYAWVTTFDLTGRDEADWAGNVIIQLKEDFDNGAVGVKVWKDIGMEIINKDGHYIQLDDPIFDPILEFIAEQGKTLIAHIGEPVDAWMPSNVDGKPQHYWARHPKFHFWDKPDRPSFSDIMAARDHVLEKHPTLRFVGAHLGSLSYDVNEIIKRLDRYPNFAVEIGGRTRYLMWQARGKVRSFFIEYQDRIMYGTDRSAGMYDYNGNTLSEDEINESKKSFLDRYDFFLRYYATDEEFPWGNNIVDDKPMPEPSYTVKGLALPKEVLEKIYYKNTVKWFPEVANDYN